MDVVEYGLTLNHIRQFSNNVHINLCNGTWKSYTNWVGYVIDKQKVFGSLRTFYLTNYPMIMATNIAHTALD